MSTTTARGIGVRHAVTRALATHNLGPADATFRVESCRVDVDHHKRVIGAEATVSIQRPRPLGERSPRELRGLVNPDGDHALMVRIGGARPFFLDVVPVTWERWQRMVEETRPPGLDALAPRTGVSLAQARSYAERVQKRLPTEAELRAAWGSLRYPWGEGADPRQGRCTAPRYGELPEVGLHPPAPTGVWDLGAWLWQWTDEGTLFGGMGPAGPLFAARPTAEWAPVGFRLARDG